MANSKTASKSSNSRKRDRRKLQDRDAAATREDLIECLKEYARQNPEKAALWCLGIGFVLGWKLKPW